MDESPPVKKVHDIYPDPEDYENQSPEDVDEPRRPSINGVINWARRRPSRIPRPTSASYTAFQQKLSCALRISIHEQWDMEVRKSTKLERVHVEIGEDVLTFHPQHSQSKLSQQELSDLQKATHFDKKELQQWYKGIVL